MIENDDRKVAFFNKRTKEHIDRVKANASYIEDFFSSLKGLVKQTSTHDQSKYEKPEVDPYIEITWNYKIGKSVNNDANEALTAASEHHVKSNKHHAEYWDDDPSPTINTKDRDKPLRLINATKMDKISIAEMVCDWQAMSQEYNEGSCRGWADKNIGIRWDFTDTQKDLIYKLIDAFEGK